MAEPTAPTAEPSVEPTELSVEPTEPSVEPTESPSTGGLLDQDPPAPTEPPDPDAPVRPDNIPERYWDAVSGTPRVDEMMKGYEEVRSRLNQKLNDESGIPETSEAYFEDKFNEEGDFIFRDGAENIRSFPKDDPALKIFSDSALEAGLTVKQTNDVLGSVMAGLDILAGAEPVDTKVEMAKLGEHAQARVDGTRVWLDGLGLNKEELVVARSLGQDAIGIQVLEKIMAETGQLSIPKGTAAQTTTHAELKAEWTALNDDPVGMDANPALAARMEEIGKILHPDPK